MPDPVVRVEPDRVRVDPGGQERVAVTIRNPNKIVEGYRVAVLGDAAGWAEVVAPRQPGAEDPDVVTVYPGNEVAVAVVFTAPSGPVALAASIPFGVLVSSAVDPTSSACEEGDLELGQVDGLSGALVPVTSKGRWVGRHAVTLRNWGTAPARLDVTASDADAVLGFLVAPPRVELSVGAEVTVSVRVRARSPFLRGAPARHPFTVVAAPVDRPVGRPGVPEPGTQTLDGAFAQKPVLSAGTVALAGLLITALVAAVAVALRYEPTPPEEPVPDIALAPPVGLVAEAKDSGSVQLRWQAVDREPDEYTVFAIDPATQAQRLPVTTNELTVPGSVNQQLMENLAAGTEQCFQLTAVQGKAQSPRTTPACIITPNAPTTTTPTAAGTTPTTPTTAAAETGAAQKEAEERAAAEAAAKAAAEKAAADKAAADKAAADKAAADKAAADKAAADKAAAEAKASAEAQASAEAAQMSTPAPVQPEVGPNDWVLIFPFAQTPDGNKLKEIRRTALEAAGNKVGEINSADYPGLTFQGSFDVLFIGPFPSESEARESCEGRTELVNRCDPARPGAKK